MTYCENINYLKSLFQIECDNRNIKNMCQISNMRFLNRIQKRAEAALDAEYPSYGVTGPNNNGSKISPSSTMSDRKLAQSAQMFHYQQQRQQMMAQEKYVLFYRIEFFFIFILFYYFF